MRAYQLTPELSIAADVHPGKPLWMSRTFKNLGRGVF